MFFRTCQSGVKLLVFLYQSQPKQVTQFRLISHKMDDRTADKTTVSYITVPDVNVARSLGSGLVTNKLAACVNIIPNIESIYEWDNEVKNDAECLLMVKSVASKSSQMTSYVLEHHPYECPEVITINVDRGNDKYLDWVKKSVEVKK